MIQIREMETTNKVGNKDWLEASKGLELNAYIEPHSTISVELGQVFTKKDFDQALKRVSRKIKK